MQTTLEVLFAPAEFSALGQRDLSGTICVVFDVLRATSSIVTALGNGAAAVLPVDGIPEALNARRREPEVLLAGERDGVCIQSALTGSIPFDLGNSPREFTKEKVLGKTIVMTTTNGTRALRACARAKSVLISTFLNLQATADLIAKENPAHLLLVCSGTFEQVSYEDILGAGALCDLIWAQASRGEVADSAIIAHRLWQLEQGDLLAGISRSRNGRRLLHNPELCDDVPFCAQRDLFCLVVQLDPDGLVRRIAQSA